LTLFPGSPAPYRWAVDELSPGVGPRRLAVALNVALFVPVGVLFGWLSRPKLLLLAPLASVVIEVVQWLLPQRHPDPIDIAANSLGAVLGYVAVLLVGRLARTLRVGLRGSHGRRRGDYPQRS
jgi:glycopeptide antibiotics resistance protein